jgi:hypothetical protein
MRKKTLETFIVEANLIHQNLYNYTLCEYNGMKVHVNILCKKHGVFQQTPDSHLHGRGCPKCVNRNTTTGEFVDRANIVHNYMYDYKLVNFLNPKTKIKIIYTIHGEFEQQPNSHLNGSGCPICKSSHDERNIVRFLNENAIKFIREKKFVDCKNKYPLPFDFYLPKYNILIEYDGEQHLKPICFFGISNEIALQNFEKVKFHDNIKNNYAKNNNIGLIRVPHTVSDVEEYLKII